MRGKKVKEIRRRVKLELPDGSSKDIREGVEHYKGRPQCLPHSRTRNFSSTMKRLNAKPEKPFKFSKIKDDDIRRAVGRKSPNLRNQVIKDAFSKKASLRSLYRKVVKLIKHKRPGVLPTSAGINVLDIKGVCQFNPSRKPQKPKQFRMKKKVKNPNLWNHGKH